MDARFARHSHRHRAAFLTKPWPRPPEIGPVVAYDFKQAGIPDSSMSEPSKSHEAYLAIKNAILEQALTPGTKLPEDMLGTHLHVSRTLIREALARPSEEMA